MLPTQNIEKSWLCQMNPGQVLETLSELFDAGAVFAVNNLGNMLYWSKGAENLFELPASAVLGQPGSQIFGFTDSQEFHRLISQDSRCQQVIRLKRIKENQLLCHWNSRALFDDNHQFAGAIGFIQPQINPSFWDDQLRHQIFHGILSRDPNMLAAIDIIRNVAETDATVLIRGESGTGKELVAHALHIESTRSQQPFLAINCAALTPNLLESELFGHVKGAFTGAIRSHAGLFQRAHRGSLFLDEVAEIPLELQAKLLRVLQEQSFIPVGGDQAVHVDVRIIAATHRSLREEVKAGRFREDLMYRLRVVPLFLPPLRERRLDIELLLWHNIQLRNQTGKRRIETIAPEAMRRLLDYQWPGNVRELKNVIEYAFAVGRGGELTIDDLPPEFWETAVSNKHNPPSSQPSMKWQNEAELINEALQICGGNLEAAAQYAGMSRVTFWRKRKKYQISGQLQTQTDTAEQSKT